MNEQLKEELSKQHKTIYALAKETGISNSDLYCAFRGEKPFYPGWRKRIAVALGKSEQALFNDTESEVK